MDREFIFEVMGYDQIMGLQESKLDGKPPQSRGPVEKNANRDPLSTFLHVAYLKHRRLSQK